MRSLIIYLAGVNLEKSTKSHQMIETQGLDGAKRQLIYLVF
jgi:hypothetical protein